MESNSSLSYAALKSVLKSLSPEMRFELIERYPEYRCAERSLPLKLHTLTLKELEFSVNNATYRLNLFAVWDKGKKPNHVPFRLLQYDVDAYGFRHEIKPDEQKSDEYRIDDRVDWRLVRFKEEAEKRVSGLVVFKFKEAHMKSEKAAASIASGKVDMTLQKLEEMWFPHKCRIGDVTPPFHHMMRYSVLKGEEVVKQENVAYKRSIYDAMRVVVFKYFGGRTLIHVETLKMNVSGFHRYPIEMKLHVKKLEITEADKADPRAVLPLLDPDCLPLRSIKTDGQKNLNEPFLQQCQELFLLNHPNNFLELKHHRVIFMDPRFPIERVQAMVKDWLENGKDLGTFYTFHVNSIRYVALLMANLSTEPGAKTRVIAKKTRIQLPHQLLIPISNTTEIKLFCKVGKGTRKVQTFNVKVQLKSERKSNGRSPLYWLHNDE